MNSPIYESSAAAHYSYHNKLWYELLVKTINAAAPADGSYAATVAAANYDGDPVERFACLVPDPCSAYGAVEKRKNEYVQFYVAAIAAGADPTLIAVNVCACGTFDAAAVEALANNDIGRLYTVDVPIAAAASTATYTITAADPSWASYDTLKSAEVLYSAATAPADGSVGVYSPLANGTSLEIYLDAAASEDLIIRLTFQK
tara:strand:+ start:618 stop:1223 length:606 start_codon:yes stop_codon:yes gene_type:complete